MTAATSNCADDYQARYDALGRRVWQQIGETRTYYLYEGDTLIAEVSSSGQVIAEYTWGPLGPLMMRRYDPSTQNWTNSYYVQDAQGHTRLLLDATGGVQSVYTYDAWGNRRSAGANSASRKASSGILTYR